MATIIGLIFMVAVLVSGGLILLRGSVGLNSWLKMIVATFIVTVLLFLLWLAIMVFAVATCPRHIEPAAGAA